MDLAEMPAGREIDDLVQAMIERSLAGDPQALVEFKNHVYDCEPTWSPSTRIENAWEVAEVLMARGLMFNVGDCAGRVGRVMRCAFYDVRRDTERGEGWYPHEGQAKTGPLAICLAALKAMT